MTTMIDISQAKQQLAELLDLAKAGNEVIIMEGNTPVARLTTVEHPSPETKPRIAGLHQGAIWVSEDFDQPLPDEFWIGNS